MRHWDNFVDIIRNIDAPLIKYSKVFAMSGFASVLPVAFLAEFFPNFSSLAKHKAVMSTNFHNPILFVGRMG